MRPPVDTAKIREIAASYRREHLLDQAALFDDAADELDAHRAARTVLAAELGDPTKGDADG